MYIIKSQVWLGYHKQKSFQVGSLAIGELYKVPEQSSLFHRLLRLGITFTLNQSNVLSKPTTAVLLQDLGHRLSSNKFLHCHSRQEAKNTLRFKADTMHPSLIWLRDSLAGDCRADMTFIWLFKLQV